MKCCTNCNKVKDLSMFGKSKNDKDGRTYWCKECAINKAAEYRAKNREKINKKQQARNRIYYSKNKEALKAYAKAFRLKNPDSVKHYDLKDDFGISLSDYRAMLDAQKHCCAICRRHESCFKKKLSVDHDHKTGAIRGLLCSGCNFGLGQFKDNFDVALNAAKYLQLHSGVV